jgi:hypothetical protein
MAALVAAIHVDEATSARRRVAYGSRRAAGILERGYGDKRRSRGI